MRKITAYAQAIVLALTINLSTPQRASAQSQTKSNKAETDQRLQKLIDERRREHWGYFETQLIPTSPPRSQPVQTLPEWYPSGGVLLTLDPSYVNSFNLNHLLRTEGKEIIKRDLETANYIKTAGCNTLYSAQKASSESFRRDPKVIADFNSLCRSVPESARTTLTLPWGKPEDAESWWRYLHRKLAEDLMFDDLSLAHTFLRIVKDFAPYTKVVILIQGSGGTGEDVLYDWVVSIKKFHGGSELLKSKNVQFVQIPIKTKWVRDYGPIFIRGVDGQIFCVDSRYNTERVSIEDKRMQRLFESIRKSGPATGEESRVEDRLYDDVSPSFLAERLRQRKGRSLLPNPINVVRPPIDLAGGDFFTDGNGIGFTSTNTLRLNGGNIELLNLVFKEYFGLKDVVYLRPLPGRTVPHIDMFFKVVSPKIILLGQFAPSNGTNASASLQMEAQRIMDYNLKVLRDFYESRRVRVNVVSVDTDDFQKNSVNIVLVPMPDLRRPAREQFERLEQGLAKLEEEREQHAKAAQNALGQANLLDKSVQSLQESYNDIGNTITKLQASNSAKSVSLPHLREISARAISAVRALYEKYGESIKLIDWQGSHQQLLEFSTYLDSQKNLAGRKLGSNDRRVLALYLRRPANALQAIISGLQAYRGEIKRTYDQHTSELARIDEAGQRWSEQIKILERQLPTSYDIYRTFLNALQVKTDRANILLIPSYSNLDAMEKRAQNIFRRVYTRAYGNVTIIPIPSDYFIQESGSIHCLTQTLPAEVDVFSDR